MIYDVWYLTSTIWYICIYIHMFMICTYIWYRCDMYIYMICTHTYVCMYVSIYLSIYLSMYVCMYLCIYVCMYVSMYLCIYVSMYLCIYVSMYLCMYVSIYLSMYVSIYLCIYVSMYLCMYVCMDIYLYIVFAHPVHWNICIVIEHGSCEKFPHAVVRLKGNFWGQWLLALQCHLDRSFSCRDGSQVGFVNDLSRADHALAHAVSLQLGAFST